MGAAGGMGQGKPGAGGQPGMMGPQVGAGPALQAGQMAQGMAGQMPQGSGKGMFGGLFGNAQKGVPGFQPQGKPGMAGALDKFKKQMPGMMPPGGMGGGIASKPTMDAWYQQHPDLQRGVPQGNPEGEVIAGGGGEGGIMQPQVQGPNGESPSQRQPRFGPMIQPQLTPGAAMGNGGGVNWPGRGPMQGGGPQMPPGYQTLR
jgi:hypothetical protein